VLNVKPGPRPGTRVLLTCDTVQTGFRCCRALRASANPKTLGMPFRVAARCGGYVAASGAVGADSSLPASVVVPPAHSHAAALGGRDLQ